MEAMKQRKGIIPMIAHVRLDDLCDPAFEKFPTKDVAVCVDFISGCVSLGERQHSGSCALHLLVKPGGAEGTSIGE